MICFSTFHLSWLVSHLELFLVRPGLLLINQPTSARKIITDEIYVFVTNGSLEREIKSSGSVISYFHEIQAREPKKPNKISFTFEPLYGTFRVTSNKHKK